MFSVRWLFFSAAQWTQEAEDACRVRHETARPPCKLSIAWNDAGTDCLVKVAGADDAWLAAQSWIGNVAAIYDRAGHREARDVVGFTNFGVVEKVADIAALTTTPARLWLDGYASPGDGGGGMLVHRPESAEPVDNALVFPAIIGRYTRPSDGVLHTKWFGLHDPSKDESWRAEQFQKFLYECAKPNENNRVGEFDGFVDLGGATVHFRRDDAVNLTFGALRGASRRYTGIKRGALSVGNPGGSGTASVVSLSDFTIEAGYIDLWNCEIPSTMRGVRIQAPGDAGHFEREYAATWPNTTGWVLYLYKCNHLDIQSCYITGNFGGSRAESLNGVRVESCVNTVFRHGGCVGVKKGVYIEGTGGSGITVDRFKIEAMNEQAIHVYEGGNHTIRANITASDLYNGGWDHTNFPLVQVGVNAFINSNSPLGVLIHDTIIGNAMSAGAVGTAIELSRGEDITVRDNGIGPFAIGIKTSAGATRLKRVRIDNNKNASTLPVSLHADTNFMNDKPDAMVAPKALTDGVTVVWDVANAKFATLALGAQGSAVQALVNARPGDELMLVLTKTDAAAAVTWDGMFKFPGTAPDFSTMLMTEHAEIRLSILDLGNGTIASCSYEIRG